MNLFSAVTIKRSLAICLPALFLLKAGAEDLTANLDHGNAQVAQMLRDRPVMAHYLGKDGVDHTVTPNDPMWQAAAKEYAKLVLGSPVNWDPGELANPSYVRAENVPPLDGKPGLIRFRASSQKGSHPKTASFDDLWSACIFELYNIGYSGERSEVYHRAILGQVTQREWLADFARTEHSALIKLKNFYSTVWEPWSQEHCSSLEPRCWQPNTPDIFELWFAAYPDDCSYLADMRHYYDTSIVPYVKETKGFDPTGT